MVEVFADKFGPSGPAARSRPRAEGCSLTSQAHPLGCGLASGGINTIDRSDRTEWAAAFGGGDP